MKKSNYLIALALGASTITFAQNVGINTDGSDPDSDAILHINNHSGSSADSSIIRIENEQNGANDVTGVEIYNSGTGATAKWDVYIPASGSTDLRIKNNGTDRITIQNDGDVGIGTTSPASGLDVKTSMGYNINTFDASNPIPSSLDNTHNVILCNDGPYTVNLPAANTCAGRVYYIKNIDVDGDDITIDGNVSETIEGSETFKLGDYKDVVRIVSNGSNWFIIEKSVLFQCGTSTVTWTYNGGSVTYGTVSSSTGECWMDRNLGASQVATSSTDYLAYGDLFQWGRGDDGHQVITWTSSTTSDGAEQSNEIGTQSSSTSPGHNDFITGCCNWYTGSNPDDLWKEDGTGVNNPCPSGWRIPSETEWNAENSAGNTDFTKYAHLKLPMAGYRTYNGGSLLNVGTHGKYWSSKVSGGNAVNWNFNSSTSSPYANYRAYGCSIRCLKD